MLEVGDINPSGRIKIIGNVIYTYRSCGKKRDKKFEYFCLFCGEGGGNNFY